MHYALFRSGSSMWTSGGISMMLSFVLHAASSFFQRPVRQLWSLLAALLPKSSTMYGRRELIMMKASDRKQMYACRPACLLFADCMPTTTLETACGFLSISFLTKMYSPCSYCHAIRKWQGVLLEQVQNPSIFDSVTLSMSQLGCESHIKTVL
jgi:hypothetical protein